MTGSPSLPTRWVRWLPWLSLGVFVVLWIARWASFPLVLDPAYHLLIARQIVEAGGPILYEWWECAPVGRPHLYPPVLHLLLAGLLNVGCTPIVAIRLGSVALLPALLLSFFLVVRRLVGSSAALCCLWVGMVPFSFHLYSGLTMAAALAIIELLWLIEALERGRWIAAGALLALLFYTHLGMPWIAVLAICAYGAFEPAVRKTAGKSSWGFLVGLPWCAHVAHHRSLLHIISRQENATIEAMPLLYVLAVLGMWRCWRLGGRWRWFLACWIGFTLLAPRHLYRWLSGEGMIPVILLAGAAVDWCAQQASGILRPQGNTPGAAASHSRYLLTSLLLFLALVLSPTMSRTSAGWRWLWPDSAPWHLLGSPAVALKIVGESVYSPQLERVVHAVARQSRPKEIVRTNAPYAGGLVAALANRPTASAMLDEVTPAHPFDPIGAAHLILWFRLDEVGAATTFGALSRYPLSRVEEDDLAVIFRQAGVTQTAPRPQAVLPFGLGVALLCGTLALIVWDMGRPGSITLKAQGDSGLRGVLG